jgi:UDP-glucuronate 4-epimerase
MLEKRIPQLTAPVLVTGGAGFIGSHVVDRFLALGERVVVIDDFNDFYAPALKRDNVAAHLAHANYTLVEGDIRDAALIEQVFITHAPKRVIHLAARAGVRPSLEDPLLYETTNVLATLILLEACRRHGVSKLVFGSSSSVYGVNAKVPFSEEDPIASTISPYAATKAAGELHCHAYSHLYGLNIVCLRFFTVYGPRQRPDLAIYKFAKLMSAGEPIPVFGDGSTERDYTYVADIVTGILGALAYDQTRFEILNLGNSRTVSLTGLIDALETALGKKAIIERQGLQPGDVPRTYADTSKARRLLGYAPDTPIAQGLARFAAWFEEARLAKVL